MIVVKHTKPNSLGQKNTHENVFQHSKRNLRHSQLNALRTLFFFYERLAVNFLKTVFRDYFNKKGFRMPLKQLFNSFLADNKSQKCF